MTIDHKLPDAAAVPAFSTDADGFITSYNDAAAKLWGWRPALGEARYCGAYRLLTRSGMTLAPERSPTALALQGRNFQLEIMIERPDGSRVTIDTYPTVLRDEAGAITGTVNLIMESGATVQADLELARLAAIVSSSDDAIVSKNLDGRINSWNAAATRMFGYQPEEIIGKSILTIIPQELQDEEREILARIQRGERIEHFDTVRQTKDGRRIDVSLTVSPLLNRHGVVVGASKIARDISERKRAEQLQRLLFEELNHRVKNTLATVQAIASQSLRTAPNSSAFVSSFGGRIRSLAKAHDVLVAGLMKGADIAEVVREQVITGGDESRIKVAGPAVFLSAKSAVNLSLALHELATNARMYGALARPDGQLALTWKVDTYPDRQLILQWRESGVPNLAAPDAPGFGTALIEQSLATQGGSATVRYLAEGVACDLIVPLAENGDNTVDPDIAALVAEAGGKRPAPRALRGKRVLIVEDEVLVAIDIENVLTDAGYTVVGRAGTLEQARELMAQTAFDAVLLDANLAGAQVDDLASSLAQRQIPFAFATAYARENMPPGFSDVPVLSKPFASEQLLNMVARLLTRH
jgi:PAS domain S-box-containing protein